MSTPGYIDEHSHLAVSGAINAMTVDVEDYFQVSAFEPYVGKDSWSDYPDRVVANTQRVLALFDENSVCATFFVLGWVAERHPDLVRSIVAGGHEVASHGMQHTRVTQQERAEFRSDIERSKKLLEDVSGQAVRGYRAASYSIGRDNLWAHDELTEAGYVYSSSIYPIHHDLYGMPEAPRFAFRFSRDGILEVPITTVAFNGRKFPCGGGGYFRLLPYRVSKWALESVNKRDKQPAVFYFHPWEIDPEQPRIAGIDAKTRFRHYLNLKRMHKRLARLVKDFKWGRMDEIFLGLTQSRHKEVAL